MSSPRESESGAVDGSRQRKFFPRLKTLLSDEYEDFLRQIIDIVEATQCAAFPMATADTPWAEAFESIYKTVASEYALPQGKNRLHKFKEKMVELWSAMQSEVTLGVKSDAHPIYRTALRQWRLHQTVMKEKKLPTTSIPTSIPDGAPEDASEDADASDQQRPRKKPRASEGRRSVAGVPGAAGVDMVAVEAAAAAGSFLEVPGHNPAAAAASTSVPMPIDLMESWTRSLSRLENMLVASGLLQQKLPSPLYELHRLKTQMAEAEFDAKVRPLYEQEIGRHLTQVTAQCRTTSQPGFLPHLIEGIEVLRQSSQSVAMRKSLDYTHKTVLTRYLRLLTRQTEPFSGPGAASSPSGGAAASHIPPPPSVMDIGGGVVAGMNVDHDDDIKQDHAEL